MVKYEVGKRYNEFKGGDGPKFAIDDAGASLIVQFSDPEPEEIEQFREGKPFEIKFTTLYGVIMISVKIGNLNWMDAPYSPNLSKGNTKYQMPQDGQGLALSIFFADSVTGELKHFRIVGLSTRFTQEIVKEVMSQKMAPFNIEEYYRNVDKIYQRYHTKDIVKLSNIRCKIH